MLPILTVIGEALGIARSLLDPDKKEKSFHVALKKNWKKALDTAEDIFEEVDSFMTTNMNRADIKRFRKRYSKLKSKFNDLD